MTKFRCISSILGQFRYTFTSQAAVSQPFRHSHARTSQQNQKFTFGMGLAGREYPYYFCSMCCHEIKRTDQSAWHADCGEGAFHLECLKTCLKHKPALRWPVCHKPLIFSSTDAGQGTFTEKEPGAARECQSLDTLPVTTRQQDPFESPSSSKADDSCAVSDLSKELDPNLTYLSCAFQSSQGLMALICQGQASVQTLTGNQVWELPLNSADKMRALRLSSALTGFSRIFYHSPGQPRDETTLILTHPKINEPHPAPGTSQVSSTPSIPKVGPDKLADIIHSFPSNAGAKSSAVDWVSPPTTCAIVMVNGRNAKLITGMAWFKPGEDHEDCTGHG
jgi:hypothetical protein